MTGKVKLNNGIEMPMEGFGVFQIPEEDCEEAVRNAIAEGYRLIDTASSYQNEEAVGRAVRSCGVPREELFITTKAYIQQMGYDNTKAAFEESLKKLGLEYLPAMELWKRYSECKQNGFRKSEQPDQYEYVRLLQQPLERSQSYQ